MIVKAAPGACSRPKCQNRITAKALCRKHYRADVELRCANRTYVRGYVDRGDVIAHIDALLATGLSKRRISALAGLHRDAVYLVCKSGRSRCTADLAAKLLSVPIPATPRHITIPPGAVVPAVGTVRRLQALVAIGYSQRYLGQRLGIRHETNTSALFRRHDFVTAATAARVNDLFDELSMTPGGSRRSIARAKANGWAPPLAWDDIDDPNEIPHTTVQGFVSFAERYDDLRQLGITNIDDVARRLGIQRDTVVQNLRRINNRTQRKETRD